MSRILIATDLHQCAVLFQGLARLASDHKPEAVILGGDSLHGTGMRPYGKTRQLTPTQCAVELQAIAAPTSLSAAIMRTKTGSSLPTRGSPCATAVLRA